MIPATTIVVTTTLAPMIGWCLDATVGCSCASFWLGVERKMEKKSVGSSQLGNGCLCIRVSEETGCCHVPICLLCLCVRMNVQEENEETKISLVRSGPVRSAGCWSLAAKVREDPHHYRCKDINGGGARIQATDSRMCTIDTKSTGRRKYQLPSVCLEPAYMNVLSSQQIIQTHKYSIQQTSVKIYPLTYLVVSLTHYGPVETDTKSPIVTVLPRKENSSMEREESQPSQS